MSDAGLFLITSEYRRFAEFSDACRQYRYFGLCYGPPGVGKTRSARRFAAWDLFEAQPSAWRAEDRELAAFADADTVFYTPEVVNSPRALADGVSQFCRILRSLREEPQRRAEQATAVARAAAIIRITGGNFRLIRRLLAQVERLLGISQLQAVTVAVVEAAREGLVVGTA